MKQYRKGKLYVKGDEGIFLGYSCRSKAYKCLIFSTHKIIESVHMRIDEFAKKVKEESKKELEDYIIVFYCEFDTFPRIFYNKEASSTKPSVVTKSQVVQTES